MHSPVQIKIYDHIPKNLEEILYSGISDEAKQAKALPPIQPFSISLEKENAIVGGVSGTCFYGSLYIDSLWVERTLRGKGFGTKLMSEAENLGRRRGMRFVTLNTMDWEALPFYQKLGYVIEFIREGYDQGSKMFMLRKSLV